MRMHANHSGATGRRPARVDDDVRQDVLHELIWDPSVDEDRIAAAVRDGVVTLTGTVPSLAQRAAARRIVERVRGVRGCFEQLAVDPPAADRRPDGELAEAASRSLQWNVEVPPGAVTCRVKDGVLALDGTVEHEYQRRAAERAVACLSGLRGVTNAIRVAPRAAATHDLATRVRTALRHCAEPAPETITVESRDGTVILRGIARSCAERRQAEELAWAAPGVTAVEDRIEVRA